MEASQCFLAQIQTRWGEPLSPNQPEAAQGRTNPNQRAIFIYRGPIVFSLRFPPAEAPAELGRVQKTASQEFFNIKP